MSGFTGTPKERFVLLVLMLLCYCENCAAAACMLMRDWEFDDYWAPSRPLIEMRLESEGEEGESALVSQNRLT